MRRSILAGDVRYLALVVVLNAGGSDAAARDLFTVQYSTGEAGAQVVVPELGFNDAEAFINALKEDAFQQAIEGYQVDFTEVDALVDVRGLDGSVHYGQNSTDLEVSFPCAGFERTFEADTRQQAEDEAEDFFKGQIDGNASGGKAAAERDLSRFLKGLVACTAVDPIAGNPTSLVARMARADQLVGTMPGVAPRENLIGVGVSGGAAFVDDFTIGQISLPLQYSFTFDHEGAPPRPLSSTARSHSPPCPEAIRGTASSG